MFNDRMYYDFTVEDVEIRESWRGSPYIRIGLVTEKGDKIFDYTFGGSDVSLPMAKRQDLYQIPKLTVVTDKDLQHIVGHKHRLKVLMVEHIGKRFFTVSHD